MIIQAFPPLTEFLSCRAPLIFFLNFVHFFFSNPISLVIFYVSLSFSSSVSISKILTGFFHLHPSCSSLSLFLVPIFSFFFFFSSSCHSAPYFFRSSSPTLPHPSLFFVSFFLIPPSFSSFPSLFILLFIFLFIFLRSYFSLSSFVYSSFST